MTFTCSIAGRGVAAVIVIDLAILRVVAHWSRTGASAGYCRVAVFVVSALEETLLGAEFVGNTFTEVVVALTFTVCRTGRIGGAGYIAGGAVDIGDPGKFRPRAYGLTVDTGATYFTKSDTPTQPNVALDKWKILAVSSQRDGRRSSGDRHARSGDDSASTAASCSGAGGRGAEVLYKLRVGHLTDGLTALALAGARDITVTIIFACYDTLMIACLLRARQAQQ